MLVIAVLVALLVDKGAVLQDAQLGRGNGAAQPGGSGGRGRGNGRYRRHLGHGDAERAATRERFDAEEKTTTCQ